MSEAYEAQAAKDAQAANYGDESYWAYLDDSAKRHHAYFLARGDEAQAVRMMTQTLSEALRGNNGE